MHRLVYCPLLLTVLLLGSVNIAQAQDEPTDLCTYLLEARSLVRRGASAQELAWGSIRLKISVEGALAQLQAATLVGLTPAELDALRAQITRTKACAEELMDIYDDLMDQMKQALAKLPPTAMDPADLRRAEEAIAKEKETKKALGDCIDAIATLLAEMGNR